MPLRDRADASRARRERRPDHGHHAVPGPLTRASLQDLRRTLAEVRERASVQRENALNLRERTRALAESLWSQHVGAIAIDGRARHLAANAAACAITGYSELELRRMTLWKLVADAHIGEGKRGWSRFLRDGHVEGTCRLRQKIGEVITIRYVAAAHVLRGVGERRLSKSSGTRERTQSI